MISIGRTTSQAPENFASNFIVDSGASVTTCNNRDSFINLVPDHTPITQPDGTVSYTVGRGSINFGTFGILHDCYYSPDFESNLLSVPHLNSFDFIVTFDGQACLAIGWQRASHR
jgi:hypothetical protein